MIDTELVIPKHLYKELEEISRKNNIPMTDFIIEMIQVGMLDIDTYIEVLKDE